MVAAAADRALAIGNSARMRRTIVDDAGNHHRAAVPTPKGKATRDSGQVRGGGDRKLDCVEPDADGFAGGTICGQPPTTPGSPRSAWSTARRILQVRDHGAGYEFGVTRPPAPADSAEFCLKLLTAITR